MVKEACAGIKVMVVVKMVKSHDNLSAKIHNKSRGAIHLEHEFLYIIIANYSI